MKNILKVAFVASFCLVTWAGIGQTVLEDEVKEENIQTVRIFSKTADFQSQMKSPVIQLHSTERLTLEFDDIAYEPDRYSAAIIHCNADWTPSGLKPADYLSQYNEFNVDEYQYSVNTRIPFIHFTFQVPQVTKSGNYVIKVYRGRQQNEVVLMRRFMVYDNQVKVGASLVPYAHDYFVQFINIFLMIFGSIGFPVLIELKTVDKRAAEAHGPHEAIAQRKGLVPVVGGLSVPQLVHIHFLSRPGPVFCYCFYWLSMGWIPAGCSVFPI